MGSTVCNICNICLHQTSTPHIHTHTRIRNGMFHRITGKNIHRPLTHALTHTHTHSCTRPECDKPVNASLDRWHKPLRAHEHCRLCNLSKWARLWARHCCMPAAKSPHVCTNRPVPRLGWIHCMVGNQKECSTRANDPMLENASCYKVIIV